MVKSPGPNRSQDSEIDLIELLLSAITAIRNNFWWILAWFVIGSGLGIAYFLTTKKQFESKMIISSNILTTSYAKVMFDNANGHLADSDHETLASSFKMNVGEVKEIASLQIDNVSKAEGSELAESDRYLITARVFDQNILPSLQRGVIAYLENNDFVKIRVEQNRASLKQMLSAVNRELKDVQQFKNDIYSGKFFSSARGNVMFDPTSVNTKVLELTQKKVDYENAIQLSSSVQLIEGFATFKHHVNPRLSVSVLAGSFFGLVAAGALIAFKSIRHLLRLAEANSTKNAA